MEEDGGRKAGAHMSVSRGSVFVTASPELVGGDGPCGVLLYTLCIRQLPGKLDRVDRPHPLHCATNGGSKACQADESGSRSCMSRPTNM